jgi:phospholipid/cholesterol/gamma-HCH transport system substrate-binding protein
METRANYILIGAFVIAGLLAIFGFLLWLAKAEVSRQYSYHDILFTSVSGLGMASEVRFNGLSVGQVVDIDLDEDDPSRVRVRIEIDARVPIKTDTFAQLESQGVTGVAYVALSGGAPDAPALPEDAVIQSRPSALQSVFEGAPELLEEALVLLRDIQTVVSRENREAVGDLLANLATASGRIDRVLTDVESLSGDLGSAARSISEFTRQLDELSEVAEGTLAAATGTLDAAEIAAGEATRALRTAQGAFDRADALLQNEVSDLIVSGRAALQAIDTTVSGIAPAITETVAAAQDLVSNRLPRMTEEIETAAAALETQVSLLGTEGARLMAQYSAVGVAAQARLEESEAVLAGIEAASREARAAITTINASVQENLPALFEELRRAAADASGVIETAGREVSGTAASLTALSEEGRGALAMATETFAGANETLAAVTAAMRAAETTLMTANGTLASIDRVVDQDLDTIASDVREAVDVFSVTMRSVAANADQISLEVLDASRSAAEVLGTVDGIVTRNERQTSDFLRVGLPQFQRFIEEGRRLVVNLQRLVDQVERDPARFLLGTQASEFNR